MSAALLPPNSTRLERALAGAMSRMEHGQLVKTLWNAESCPMEFLPWLAWALSVDDWDENWSEERKRRAIKEARRIHEHKGTLGAVRRALTVMGQPDADIVERSDFVVRNGTARRNGTRRRFGQDGWATFRVVLKRPVTIDQAMLIRSMLENAKRNCVHLVALDFRQAALRRNGVAIRDGSYTRGVVTT